MTVVMTLTTTTVVEMIPAISTMSEPILGLSSSSPSVSKVS